MSNASTLTPVLLLPLKLETRFVKNKEEGEYQLWIRIFPDALFLNSFNPNLTGEEKKDHKRFSQASTEGRQDIWKELVNKYGVYRAKWVIRPNLEFLDGPEQTQEEVQRYFYEYLPDSFKIYLFDKHGNPISNPEGEEEFSTSIITNESPLEVLGDQADWLTNFSEAVGKRMATKINLGSLDTPDPDYTLGKIVVVGLRNEKGPKAVNSFRQLLANQEFTNGFAFLDYGTPTNNTSDFSSGYRSQEEFDALGSYEYAVEGESAPDTTWKPENIPNVSILESALNRKFERPPTKGAEKETYSVEKLIRIATSHAKSTATSHGEKASLGLGIESSSFQYTQNNEGFENPLIPLIQKATWFAMGGQMMDLLFGDMLDPEDHCWLWEHYGDFVSPKGHLPAIRIDDQPYGILPVTHPNWIHTADNRGDLDLDKRLVLLGDICQNLKDLWLKYTDSIPRKVHEDPSQLDLPFILSHVPYSKQFQIGVLGLPRIQGYLSPFYQRESDVPVDLSSLSIGQVYQLLDGIPEIKTKLDLLTQEIQKINQVIPDSSSEDLFQDKVEPKLLDSPFWGMEKTREVPSSCSLQLFLFR